MAAIAARLGRSHDVPVYQAEDAIEALRAVEDIVASWRKAGHLFLALESCGASALWLVAQLDHPEVRAEFDKGYMATRKHPLAHADDVEVAIFFEIWPERRPRLLEAVEVVGLCWRTRRTLSLGALLARKKGADGAPIAERWKASEETRMQASEDMPATLWLTAPNLAVAAFRKTPVDTFEAHLIQTQVDAKKLLEGVDDDV